jgi:hypothetical protein
MYSVHYNYHFYLSLASYSIVSSPSYPCWRRPVRLRSCINISNTNRLPQNIGRVQCSVQFVCVSDKQVFIDHTSGFGLTAMQVSYLVPLAKEGLTVLQQRCAQIPLSHQMRQPAAGDSSLHQDDPITTTPDGSGVVTRRWSSLMRKNGAEENYVSSVHCGICPGETGQLREAVRKGTPTQPNGQLCQI